MDGMAAGRSRRRRQGLLQRVERRVRRTVVRLRGQRVLAVLGMHRSGTSSLAGSLEAGGLYLGDGDVAGAGRWNAKGNRESKVLMRLHEQILTANGGSWDRPPTRVTWGREHRRRRDAFIRSRATRPYWGFKDPRTLLLIDGWIEAIPDLAMVATIREPVAVARSLQRRAGGGEVERWMELWLVYNRRLLELQAEHGFALLDFDLPAEAYAQRLRTVAAELGLEASPAGEAFFEPSLRTAERDEAVAVPREVEELHAELQAIAARQATTAVSRTGR